MEATVVDTFDRPDDAGSLGRSSVGRSYEVAGTWGVSGQRGYVVVVAGVAVALHEGPASVGAVTAGLSGLTATSGINAGLAFLGDGVADFLWCDINNNDPVGSNRVRIVKVDAGAASVIASTTVPVATWGDSARLRVEYDGRSGQVLCYVDGVLRLSHTLNGAEVTKYGRLSKIGMRLDNSSLRIEGLISYNRDVGRRRSPARLFAA